MGTWGTGNFDSDAALDYMGDLIDELAARIEEIFDDEERSALDEDGEGMLVPTVAVISTLIEHSKAPAPEPGKAEAWKERYLAIYDAQIDGLDPSDDYKEERRDVIESTFDRLIEQTKAFWREEDD